MRMLDELLQGVEVRSLVGDGTVAVGRLALTDPYAPLRWAARLGVDDSPMPVQYRRGVWG